VVVLSTSNIPPEGQAGYEREFSFTVRVTAPSELPDGFPLSSVARVFADDVTSPVASCVEVTDGKCPYDPRMGNTYPVCMEDSASIGFKLRKVVCSNVITPNGDGENDCFFVRDIAQYASATLTVVSRWGSVVYTSQNYLSDCWDGGGLNEGVYFYTLTLREVPGAEEEKYTGYVHLIR
jgi:gliding motility-associated-like protein